MNSILIMLHCDKNTGYAITSFERFFLESALLAGFALENTHFSYKELDSKRSSLIADCQNKLKVDFTTIDGIDTGHLTQYIIDNKIETVLAFDLMLENRLAKVLIEVGVKKLISYWGAPMGSINSGIKLLLKKIDVWLYRYKPTQYNSNLKQCLAARLMGEALAKTR